MLSLSLPTSQPEPKLTSRLHFQRVPPFITRQGCGKGVGSGGYGRGPVMGQSVPLTPPFLLHRLLRIQASATDSSHTPLLQPLQWTAKFIQGRRDLLPSLAPLLLHPCLLPLLFSSFFSLLVTLFPWLFSLTLYPSALVPLLSPLGHHSSYFVPLVLAQCLGCPDSKEEVAAYPSGCLGLANGKKKRSRGPHS